MAKRTHMTDGARENYLALARWIAQGIGPHDVGDLPAEFHNALDALAADEPDDNLRWLVETILTFMAAEAPCDRRTYDALQRVVALQIAKEQKRPGTTLPATTADLIASLAVALHEGEIAQPPKARGRPKGAGKGAATRRRDPAWRRKVAVNVEAIARAMERAGHKGGRYIKAQGDPQRTAAGIVAEGLGINYDEVVKAYREHDATLRE